jgi:hypothetical protein
MLVAREQTAWALRTEVLVGVVAAARFLSLAPCWLLLAVQAVQATS